MDKGRTRGGAFWGQLVAETASFIAGYSGVLGVAHHFSASRSRLATNSTLSLHHPLPTLHAMKPNLIIYPPNHAASRLDFLAHTPPPRPHPTSILKIYFSFLNIEKNY